MKHQNIIFTNEVSRAITTVLAEKQFNKLFIVTDTNSCEKVLPRIADNKYVSEASILTIEPGDVNKNLDSLSVVWRGLEAGGGTRQSLVINLGGGVVTDLGGFAAATYKRGIPFINIPTTLLSAVDAAVGGKTGVNFNGLKNEIGVFCEATDVIISTVFFDTLPAEELKSGYAEMLKHGLLKSDEAFQLLMKHDLESGDKEQLLSLLKESVEVKAEIVKQDPTEQNIRRALNLGHTAGHAFESLAMQRNQPIPHGYAVAYGLVIDAILSHFECGFDSALVHRLADYVLYNYDAFYITCDDYDALLTLMKHDKKSRGGEINCTLLGAPGDICIDCVIPDETMKEALDLYRDLMRI